jgi:hypothetical protein
MEGIKEWVRQSCLCIYFTDTESASVRMGVRKNTGNPGFNPLRVTRNKTKYNKKALFIYIAFLKVC